MHINDICACILVYRNVTVIASLKRPCQIFTSFGTRTSTNLQATLLPCLVYESTSPLGQSYLEQ